MASGQPNSRRPGAPPRASQATSALSSAQAQAPSPNEGASATTVNGEQHKPHKRGGRKSRKKKNRRQSFATPSDHGDAPDTGAHRPSLLDVPEETSAESQFDRLGAVRKRKSNESMDSETLLDHRYEGSAHCSNVHID